MGVFRLNVYNFTKQGIPDRRNSMWKREMLKINALVLTCGMRRVLRSEEDRSCLVGEHTRRRPDR